MRRITLLMIVASFWGCDQPSKIQVEPAQPLLKTKTETVQLRVTVLNSKGKPMPKVDVAYKSLTPTTATVDSHGTVQPVASGTATILVTAGGLSKNVEVAVQIAQKIEIQPSAVSRFQQDFRLMVGITKGYKIRVINDRGNPMIAGGVRWASSDPSIFSVDASGNLKTLTEGRALLKAFAAGLEGSVEIVVKHEELDDDGLLTQ